VRAKAGSGIEEGSQRLWAQRAAKSQGAKWPTEDEAEKEGWARAVSFVEPDDNAAVVPDFAGE